MIFLFGALDLRLAAHGKNVVGHIIIPAIMLMETLPVKTVANIVHGDNITSALVANKIASKQWRMWLKACYNCDSAQDIKQEMLDGIMQTIESVPDTIKNFGK